MASIVMAASNSRSNASSWRPIRSSREAMPFDRAWASMPADWSTPTTRRPDARTSAKYLPVPHGASRTVPPDGQVASRRSTNDSCEVAG
jgi:hypothetical protein